MHTPIWKAAFGTVIFLLAATWASGAAYAEEPQAQQRSSTISYHNYSDEELRRAKRAVKANRKACRKGDLEACIAAGDAYLLGEGVENVGDIAAILYGDACDAGFAKGCSKLGKFHAGAGGSPMSFPKAASFYEKACDLGDLSACIDFAGLLQTQALGPPDLVRSSQVLENTCQAGSSDACRSLAILILNDQQRLGEHDRALSILDGQCRQEVLDACSRLISEYSENPDENQWQIGEYQHLACFAGSVLECLNAGERVYKGIGVEQDRELAISYYDQACQLGSFYCDIPKTLREFPRLEAECGTQNPRACADLGIALSVPDSPEADVDTAISALEWSCLNGVGEICGRAATVITNHKSSEDADWPSRLVAVLERSCEAKDPDGCLQFANALLDSDWVATDTLRAAKLFNQLCTQQVAEACAKEEQFSGLVPEVRIAVADENFIPPEDADEPTTVPQERLVIPDAPDEDCVEVSERFRGKTYTQYNCPSTAASIGSYRLRPGRAPWQALLWRPKRLAGQTLSEADRVLCGASLIAKGWVLTAAHCLVDNGTSIRRGGHKLRLGVYNPRRNEGITFPILRAIPHPQYNKSNKYVYDIALIQYDHRAGSRSSTVRKIASITLDPLQVGRRKIAQGMPVYSYGWGWTKATNSQSTDYLQAVRMELRSESACTRRTKFRGRLLHAALCAAGRNRQQTCYGDSGGPLVYYGDARQRPTLIGVVSAGKKCGATGRPSQYTRVAKVKSWIARYVSSAR